MKVIVVDDTAEGRLLLHELFKSRGYDVLQAENGLIALETIRRQRPQLVISDIQMPEMDGFELCRQIKADPELEAIPVVIYSSVFGEREDERLALDLGASLFIHKPIEPDEFLKLISPIIDQHEGNRLVLNKQKTGSKEEQLALHNERLTFQLDMKMQDLGSAKRSFDVLIGNLRGMVYRRKNDKDWTMQFVSDACLNITGYPPHALIDNKEVSYAQLIHEADRDRVQNAVQSAIDKNSSFEIEYRLKHRDGSTVWVFEQGICVHPGTVPELLEGYISDITQRRKDSMERNRFFELSLEMLCVAGTDGYFKQLNPSWSRVLGWSESELLASPWNTFVHPDDRETTDSATETLVGGDVVFSFTNRYMHKNGGFRWLSWNSMPLPEEGLLFGAARDVTEEMARESQLSRLNRALRILNAGNVATLRGANEISLLNEMCEVLVQEAGYPVAWVGFVMGDDIQSIKPVASAGIEEGVLNALDNRWDDTIYGDASVTKAMETVEPQLAQNGPNDPTTERVDWPIITAIKTGEPQLIRNIRDDPVMAGWHGLALKHGLTALLSLPLSNGTGGPIIGALNIYGAHEGVFDQQETQLLKELANDLSYGIGTHRMQVEKVQTESLLEESLFQAIQAVALTVEKRDPYTAGHQNRVAQLAVAIATEMNLSKSEIDGIRLGATIHDIGKIYVPAEILNRPGRLTENEFGMIKTHSEVGYEIISGVTFPWPIADMVRQHHERLDGSGYPQGLKGAEIILEARIIAVADVMEAITSHRPYRPALGIEAGLEEIVKKRGEWFDPQVVDVCVRLVTEERFQFD